MGISLRPEYLKRYKDIAMLFLRYGHGDLVRMTGLDSTLVEEDHTSADTAGPEQLAKDLEAMGPIYIKLGQVLSSRPDILPSPYVKALSRLQDNLEPFSFADVETIVQEELGVRISKAFLQFESTPIASASLGQVHRAQLRDGREVAVKVQRPGIRDQIVHDLSALNDIAEFLDAHTEIGKQYQLVKTLDEFRRTLAKELDYRQEARNLTEIGENLKTFPNIIVPQPIEDYSSAKVLTMDYVRGRKITTLGPLVHLEMDGTTLAEEFFQAYLKQILIDGLFHADPHPGNVFITNDRQIALIDLGMVGRLTPSMQEELLKLLLSISEMRSEEAADIALKIGQKNRNRETAQQFDESAFRHRLAQMFDMRLGGKLQDMQVGMALMDYTRICAESGVIMPVELTMLGKTLLNLDDVGRTLDPNFDPNAAIKRNAMAVTQSRIGKSLSPAALLTTAMEAKEFAQELPGRINKILDAIAKNQITVQVDAIEEETLIEGFQKVANRITTGVVLASLIIGAALLMRVQTSFTLFGYPGLAILCFLVAAMGGFWLLVEIAVKDRQN